MRLKILLLFAGALLITPGTDASAQAADAPVSLHAVLVSASRTDAESDRRLAPYESTLRRILRFESFRQLGSGRSRAAVPGQGSLSVGQGQVLRFATQPTKGEGIRVQLEWKDGSRTFMRTGLVLRPGVPAVLGGPRRENGDVFALIVIAE